MSLQPKPAAGYHGRMETKRIVFLAAPRAQILDVTGPFQIFFRASEIWNRRHPGSPPAYNVELCSTSTNTLVETSCGLGLAGSLTYRSLRGRIDTLLVAGGGTMEGPSQDQAVLRWLRMKAKQVRRIGSICTGAFLLAAAGLLDGKRVATHWKWCDDLARRYPDIQVDSDPIFIKDGKFYTSAGITAGMDLALALVEEDLDSELALQVAREMVLYLRRQGGQSQFSAALSLQIAHRSNFQKLHSWVLDHLAEDLSVESLAARAAMSPRNFARVFLRETGTTPAKFVERLRLEAARRMLEETDAGLDEAASDCGFGSAESMRRVFLRILHVTPGEYHSRFMRISHPA
jgi:Transcriptional regulator containing an amidase domain and an AraC-type DNA-binding HTH domain